MAGVLTMLWPTMKRNKDVGRGEMPMEALESRRMLAFGGLPTQTGSSGVDLGHRAAATPDGGYIAAGLFSGTVDFDPSAGSSTLTSIADTDIYLAKYSASGTLEWAQRLGGTGKNGRIKDQDRILDIASDPRRVGEVFVNGVSPYPKNAGEYITDIVVDTDGSFVITGEFVGKVDFPVVGGTQSFKTFDDEFYDAFVARYDSSGQMVWAKRFGDRFTDVASAAAIDPAGNILVTGLFTRTVSFVPGNSNFTLTARGRADGYAMKLTSAGNVLWVNAFGSDATDQAKREAGNDITTDSAGNVYVAGSFGGRSDFDPSKTGTFIVEAKDLTDAMLVKYSAAGKFRAVLAFGGNRSDALTHVAVDSNNDIIIGGYFQGEKFDIDPTSAVRDISATPPDPGDDPEKLDVFVEKLSRGRVAWFAQLKGDRSEFLSDLALDSNNNVVVAGAFYGTATFGNGATINSVRGPDEFRDKNDSDRGESYDAFLWKIASGTGSTQFVRTIGAEQDDFAQGLSIGSDDSIILTGRFRSVVDFDPGAGQRLLTALGMADAFTVAFDSAGIIQ